MKKTVAMLALLSALDSWAGLKRGVLVINQDDSQFQLSCPAESMSVEGAKDYFDSVNLGNNTHFFICPNAHCASFDSQVWDTVYRTDPDLPTSTNALATNTKLLVERGVDRFQIWIDRAREKGISPWFTQRMNDVHFIGRKETCYTSRFWLEHPEWRRVPGFDDDGDGQWALGAFDYQYQGVRDHAMALARELLERWDVDGFECDWQRFPNHLSPEIEKRGNGVQYLTAYMREMRNLVDEMSRKRGKKILLGVRVASRIACAKGLGADAIAWAREGLVDWVTVSSFFGTNDWGLECEEYRSALFAANHSVRMLVGFDCSGVALDVQGGNQVDMTRAECAGYFERMYAEGVRDFYGFNFFRYTAIPCQRFVQVDGIPGEGALRAEARTYPITYCDSVPEGMSTGSPFPLELKERKTLNIKIGKVGNPAEAHVNIAMTEEVLPSSLENATLNGVCVTNVSAVDAASWLRQPNCAESGPKGAYRLDFPVSALRDGVNEVAIGPASGVVCACELFLGAETSVLAELGIGAIDTFEEDSTGVTAEMLENWRGEDAMIGLETYDPPVPPGYVMSSATHTRVLDAVGGNAIRIVPENLGAKDKLDVMVYVCRAKLPLSPLGDDVQLRIACDQQGRLCLWHLYEEDGVRKRGWIPLSSTAHQDGEWVRIGIELDYASSLSGDAFVKVTVNGSCQPTAHGVRAPTDLRIYGPWHYLARNRLAGGVALPKEIVFAGTKVDDLKLCKQSVEFEHEGPTSVAGIEFAWFDNMGLPRDPSATAPFLKDYTLGDVYAAGLDPYLRRIPVAGVDGSDSFEEYSVGVVTDDIANWDGGNCSVELASYVPPMPPGFVMTEETHTRVLDATEDDAIRHVSLSADGESRVDVMVCVQRSAKPLKPLPDDIQLRVAADEQGHLCLWHLYEDGGEWRKGWVPLSDRTCENGEWVRVEIDFDYTSNKDGNAFACVKVNGSCQPTAHGVRSPTDLRAYGPWHYLAKNRRTGGVVLPSEISFTGTKVDDLMLCKKTVVPEHTGATSVDGIEFSWFDNAGLPRNPLATAPFIPGYTLGDIYAAGLDPYSDHPFEVTGFELDANGRPHIEFNGYKGETPVGYRVLYSPTPDFKNATTLGTSDGAFEGDEASRSTTWNGNYVIPGGTGFYKVEAIR